MKSGALKWLSMMAIGVAHGICPTEYSTYNRSFTTETSLCGGAALCVIDHSCKVIKMFNPNISDVLNGIVIDATEAQGLQADYLARIPDLARM